MDFPSSRSIFHHSQFGSKLDRIAPESDGGNSAWVNLMLCQIGSFETSSPRRPEVLIYAICERPLPSSRGRTGNMNICIVFFSPLILLKKKVLQIEEKAIGVKRELKVEQEIRLKGDKDREWAVVHQRQSGNGAYRSRKMELDTIGKSFQFKFYRFSRNRTLDWLVHSISIRVQLVQQSS